MTSNNKYGRKSIRFKNYNYAANGYYFVTICTHKKQCFFGNVIKSKMQLSPIGKIAQQYWAEIPKHSEHPYLDEYVIMPNHVHGIIIIDNPNNPRRYIPWNISTVDEWDLSQTMSKLSPKSGSLSVIIRSYKSSVTRWCRKNGDDIFRWQSRFYEHIIRNDGSLDRIRAYILNNPGKWSKDKNNPVT